MTERMEGRGESYRSDAGPLAMIALAVPLFIWSAFNAGYFDDSSENFIIPLSVFFGAPIAFATAMWAFYRRDSYLATGAGVFAAFWVSYGMLLWLTQEGVITGETTGDVRGFFFVPWAVTFGTVWLASMRQHWTLALVAMGAAVMFVSLSIAHFDGSSDLLKTGGWVGFLTAGLAWYAALAEMVNIEFEREVLPTSPGWFERLRTGSR